MIRVIFHLLLLIASANYSLAQNNVAIEAIRGYNEDACKFCAGKIVVSKGPMTDTIYGGQWGNPPNYSIKRIKNTEILIIDDEYGYAGGSRIRIFQILSLEPKSFLSEIFKKEITIYTESYLNENNNPTNLVYSNDLTFKITDSLEIINNITYESCPETDDKCDTILMLEDTEWIYLGELLPHKK